MPREAMTGGDAVVAALERHGVDTVFGIPGGHSLGIYDALARRGTIRHILGRHEQGLGFMADGYARASGRVGVVLATSGPAVANLACAVGGATTDSSRVLAVATTVPCDLIGRDRGGLHDCGQTLEIMRQVCRRVHRCRTVQEIPTAVADLIHDLQAGRPGGAYCEIPCDLLGRTADVEIPDPRPVERRPPDPARIAEAVRLLAGARRPVIWSGMGAIASDAGREVEQLALRLGAIVVTTTLGRGILPSDHPNTASLDGALWTEVNDVVAQADVVLAVGTMFKQEDTVDWRARPGGSLIHIDIDPAEIGRSFPATVGIVADAKTALQELIARLPPTAPDPAWTPRGKQAERARLARRREQSPVEMRALDILQSSIPKNAIVFHDRCNLGYWGYRCAAVREPRTFHFPMGYGGLGGSLPQALGAKLACPERTVVAVIGDGGFHFTSPELGVAVQERIPVTVIVCNNHGYGAIRAKQRKDYAGRQFGCDLVNPDFALLARAHGLPFTRVDDLEDFPGALERATSDRSTWLIELAAELADP